MQYDRYMGLDYGNSRIGIAFSDLSGTIATADSVYKRKSEEEDISFLVKLAKEKDVQLDPGLGSCCFCDVLPGARCF